MSLVTNHFPSPQARHSCPIFVDGEWREAGDVGTAPVHNPSTGAVIAEAPMCTAAHVNAAVEAAASAFPKWRETRLLEQADLPRGVFNLVHGGRECVDALLSHQKVRAISFVGFTPIARYIFETGTRHGKRVQANGGAKNFVLIMPDADVENSTRGVIEGAFGCAGERCMASSTALVIGGAARGVLPSLSSAARKIKVGPTDRDPQPE